VLSLDKQKATFFMKRPK